MVSGKLFDTDRAAHAIFACLRDDAYLSTGDARYLRSHLAVDDIRTWRSTQLFPEPGIINPYIFKWDYQLSSVFKKYRFNRDVYTDDELERMTSQSYVDFQSSNGWRPWKIGTKLILREARRIMSSLLGEYDSDEMLHYLHMGKKSSIGCPLASAHIDVKLTKPKSFTSSTLIARWFDSTVLPIDPVLGRIVRRLRRRGYPSEYASIEHLNLVNVPKSWKTYRGITPLTLLGLYYTYGIGGMLVKRLETAGLDIRYAQKKHRQLAEEFSRDLSHATADLSRASDSITKQILMAILPRKWWNAIRHALSHKIMIDGKQFHTESVLPMGNGFTFPLETLVFYCLIQAVGHISRVQGTYKVYGDDLIYPSRIHAKVAVLFEELGFTLNKDKTYVSYPFRESCGGDYYRGTDVRPFLMPDQFSLLTKTKYLAFLYKCANGLSRRWDDAEIASTLRWIRSEIESISGTVFVVPPSFPDFSGWRATSSSPIFKTYPPLVKSVKGFVNPKTLPVTCMRFTCLAAKMKRRFVVDEECYYWLALQGSDDYIPLVEYDAEKQSVWSEYLNPKGKGFTFKLARNATKGKDGKIHKWVRPYVDSKSPEDLYYLNQVSSVINWN